MGGCALAGVGALGLALSTQWWMIPVAALPLGVGSGFIDAAVNAHVSLNRGVRYMGWLHASWALGAALGPQAIVVSLAATGSWRTAFAAMAVAFLGIGVLVSARRDDWRGAAVPEAQQQPTSAKPATEYRRALLLLAGLFLVGAGLHVLRDSAGGKGVHYFDVWTVAAVLFWAFLGWESLSFGLEEFHEPERSIPTVYWASFGIVGVLYLALGFTTIGADAEGVRIAGASGLTALIRETPVGDVLLPLMILVILANANAWVFGASRSIYAAGREGILPRRLGRLSSRSIPAASLLALFAVYVLVVLVVQYGDLSLTRLILIVSQNLLVLYAFSIFAYWRTERGGARWLVASLALVSWAFLLSGFSYWIAYPAALLLLGFVTYRRRRA